MDAKKGIKKPVHKTSGTLKCRVLSSRTELRYDMGEVFIQIYPDEYLLRLQKDRR